MGEITLHVAQIVNTEQLQHCMPRNMVGFRYITVNTVYKDNQFNNNNNDNNNNLELKICAIVM
jgi:hypothetical protein